MIARKMLLSRLSDVDAALAPAAGPFPIQGHYWFTGTHLMTFNGKISLMVPFPTDFAGGVPRRIVPLLKTTAAEEIEMTADAETLVIRANKSKFKLPMMPAHEFNFKMPAPADDQLGVDPGRFMQTVEACLRSCGNITHTIDLLGITVIEEVGRLLLFSTDAETITHGDMKLTGTLGLKTGRTILPLDFCKAFVKMAGGADKLFMSITDDYAIVDHNDVTLYGLTIEPDTRPLAFKALLYDVFTRAVEDRMVRMVPELIPALERAAIITTKAKDNPRTTVEVKKSVASIYGTSEHGEAIETVSLAGTADAHPDVVTMVNAARMLEGCLNYERMVITTDAVIFTRDQLVFMVSGGL